MTISVLRFCQQIHQSTNKINLNNLEKYIDDEKIKVYK